MTLRISGRVLASTAALAIATSVPSLPLVHVSRSPDITQVDVIVAMRREARLRPLAAEFLAELTDTYGGRLTGSPAARNAAAFTISKLRGWGVSNPRLEAWGRFGPGWSNERASVRLLTPVVFPIHAIAAAWTPGTPGVVHGDAVVVLPAEDTASLVGRLSRRIVLVTDPKLPLALAPSGQDRLTPEQLRRIASEAPVNSQPSLAEQQRQWSVALEGVRQRELFFARQGAIAVVVSGRMGLGSIFTDNGGSRDLTAPSPLPRVAIDGEQYARVGRLLRRGTRVSLEIDVQNTFYRDSTTAWNIIAEIPGTDSVLRNDVVMIGAHFDSFHAGTGATDNGAGVAIMVEAMRLLATVRAAPRRTIRLALWTGEEQFMLGADAYVQQHFGGVAGIPPTSAHRGFSVYLNVDNGAGAIRGVYLQGDTAARASLSSLLRPFADWGAGTVSPAFTYGTDHESFDAANLPAFQFIQDSLDYGFAAHTSADVVERAPPTDLERNAVIVAGVALGAANRQARIPRKR